MAEAPLHRCSASSLSIVLIAGLIALGAYMFVGRQSAAPSDQAAPAARDAETRPKSPTCRSRSRSCRRRRRFS